MDLKQLQSMGALSSSKLLKRTVKFQRPVQKPAEEWADPDVPEFTGETAEESVTVHIRRRSAADSLEFLAADARERPFLAIARLICNQDGTPLFPDVDTASRLEMWLAVPLLEAANAVQGQLPNASTPRTNSGASSPSPSGDEASGSGSTP